MELKVYNQEGKETGKIKLPVETFGLPWNSNLVHQVMLALQANKRKNTAHAKTRADVRGGGRKPWRQKGTGRARHGSIRSPIWRGGGVAFGPSNERVYAQKINKKMKRKALLVALSQKVRDNEILILDDLKLKAPKTKEAATILKLLSKIKGFEKLTGKKNTALVLIKEKNENLKHAFHNLPGVLLNETRNLNLLDTLTYKYLIFSKSSLDIFK
ncbi:MAG: 50S ribosomal protein L4 [Candidatus Tagabacteria bacterium CG_4_9_14_0_2_um_filter_41_11]|uniref:Large ribosomal subunit protein uL4 n=1 Tax=Candidatus Tagabacteria bacterium CG_4_9_14_0_2_um_filter_41_11 TaxID=1975019 RepID=A0A2M8ERQ3_9BACT|nr:MAG: 50S ribosomal protein L4 [Candidatus Tagabacteria bacterium CG_4_9_14_0_2_um_filter_41_11]